MMDNVSFNHKVYLENVIYFRDKVKRSEMEEISDTIDYIIMRNHARRVSNRITATHSVELDKKQIVVDWEIMVAVDREIPLPKGFKMIPVVEIDNVMRMRVAADYKSLNYAMPKAMEIIDSLHNAPMTPFYVEIIENDIERYAEIFVGLYNE